MKAQEQFFLKKYIAFLPIDCVKFARFYDKNYIQIPSFPLWWNLVDMTTGYGVILQVLSSFCGTLGFFVVEWKARRRANEGYAPISHDE